MPPGADRRKAPQVVVDRYGHDSGTEPAYYYSPLHLAVS